MAAMGTHGSFDPRDVADDALPDLTALDDTASRKAQAFLAEAATEQWVYDCNTNHCQASSAMDTFLKWEEPSMARSWTWVCQTNAWSISGCSAGGLGGASAGRC